MAHGIQLLTRKNTGKSTPKKHDAKLVYFHVQSRRRTQKTLGSLFDQAAAIPKVSVLLHQGNESVLADSINRFASAELTEG